MRKIIFSLAVASFVWLTTPLAQASVTWQTYKDSNIIYQYPKWVAIEPTMIWQSATAASPTVAVNDEGFCAFTMAYEPKGLTGDFKKAIPARLTTRAAEVNGSILFSNILTAYFESQVTYPYVTNRTEATLIQATYGYRSANGDAYYLAYTSDLGNFEGGCKELMFSTMASLKQRADSKEMTDTKSAAIVTKISLGTYIKSSGKPMSPTTIFRNKQQFCFSGTLTKSIAAKSLKQVLIAKSNLATMNQLTVKPAMTRGSFTSCGTLSTSVTPAGKYEFRLYYKNKLVSELPFTIK